MKIGKRTARELINEVSSIIDYDINIMDERGTIMASTDPSRAGQFHEGAHLVITRSLPELSVYYDGQFTGCRKGINLPILSDGEIIGVVGITGEISQVNRYARLIKKVTEILIKDFDILQKEDKQEHARQLFINSWLNGEWEDPALLAKDIQKYGLDPDVPMIASIIRPLPGHEISDILIKALTKSQFMTCQISKETVAIGCFPSPEKCAERLSSCMEKAGVGGCCICAIGTVCSERENIPDSFKQAKTIIDMKKNSRPGIYMYDHLLLDVIISSVDPDLKGRFIKHVFGDCDKKEISGIADFIDIYYRSNGSIKAVSQALFIHKNTVQYKINRIAAQTGLDPRASGDLMALYLACRWCRDR